jgi:hypothetical protein
VKRARSLVSPFLPAYLGLATAFAAPAAVALMPATAFAADDASISGVVTDARTKLKLKDAVVVLQCTCLQGQRETQTDANGLYVFRDLPPGTYTVQVLFGKADVSKVMALPRSQKARHNFLIDPDNEERRKITVTARPVSADTASRTVINMEQARNIPVGGTNRDAFNVVEMSATASRDSAGISLAGTSGAESKYTVEGANVNNPSFGTVGASIVQEFIDTVEVTESGYDAEFGGASGGQVAARRLSGSNKVRGVARFTFTPRLAQPRFILNTDEALRVTQVPDYSMQGVVAASGPIIKDKLFWSAGVTLTGTEYSLVQQFYKREDKDGSGGFEDCPYKNGDNDCVDGHNFIKTSKFAQQEFGSRGISGGYFGGIDWAINPKHRIMLTAIGGPGFERRSYRLPFGAEPNAFGGNPTADPLGGATRASSGTINDHFGWDRANQYTISAGYLGRVAKDTMEIDAGLGFSQFTGIEAWKLDNKDHRYRTSTQEQDSQGGNLYEFLDRDGAVGNVPGVSEACNSADLPGLACPTRRWLSGGIGSYGRDTSTRVEGRLHLTHFFTTGRAGSHQLKYGTNIEHVQRDSVTKYSGRNDSDFYSDCTMGKDLGEACYDANNGYAINTAARVNNHRFIIVDVDNPESRSSRGFGRVRYEEENLRAIATPLGAGMRADGYDARLSTQNYSVFLQDKWAILSNLYVNAGVRWEIQDMRDVFGNRALMIWDNVGPRVGIVYDWTDEGKSRLYASYGWFYQPLPLQLTSRTFGGLVQVGRTFRNSDCENKYVTINGETRPRYDGGQPTEFCTDFNSFTTGLTQAAVVPHLKGMYREQFQLGYQQEIIEDLLVRVNWLHTNLGRAVEDVSTDGGNNFLVANPGVAVSDEDIKRQQDSCASLQMQIDNLPMGDEQRNVLLRERERCEYLADAFTKINTLYNKPTQNFDAFTFELQKRFARNWTVLASYTYSRLIGNYQGFVDPILGNVTIGVDPQYDIPELVRNAYGLLPFDQRHRVRLNGFYTFDLQEAGRLTFGTSLNINSGYPVSLRGDNNRYSGSYLIYVLPRGSAGRVEPNYQWNLSVSYAYPLPKDLEIEFSARILNVTNAKAVLRVDEVYTFQTTRPVAGGDLSDLKHTKIQSSGNPTDFFQRGVIAPQGNFGVETRFQNPMAAQFDLMLRF